MGYYTNFDIIACERTNVDSIVVCSDEKRKEILEWMEENLAVPFENYVENLEDIVNEQYKWYSFEEDMTETSKAFPDVYFIVEGQGEAYDDFWKAYFYNGDEEFTQGVFDYEPAVSDFGKELSELWL